MLIGPEPWDGASFLWSGLNKQSQGSVRVKNNTQEREERCITYLSFSQSFEETSITMRDASVPVGIEDMSVMLS